MSQRVTKRFETKFPNASFKLLPKSQSELTWLKVCVKATIMDIELSKPLKFCFFFLKLVGFWQDGKQSWQYFFYGIAVFLFFLVLFPIILIVNALTSAKFVDKVESVASILISCMVTIKSLIIIFNLKQIITALDLLDKLLKFSENPLKLRRSHIQNNVKKAFTIMKLVWSSGLVTWLNGLFFIFLNHKMPYLAWFPFDTENSSIGIGVASFYMMLDILIAGSLGVVISILPVIFLSFMIGLIEELTERLSEIKDKAELIKCIEIHQRIIEFTKEIQKMFSKSIFVQFTFSSMIMCTIVFAMSHVSCDYLILKVNNKTNFTGNRTFESSSIFLSHHHDQLRRFSTLLLRKRAFSCIFKTLNIFISFRLDTTWLTNEKIV